LSLGASSKMYLHVDGALEKCKILGGSESPPPDKYSYNCQTQLFDILYPLNKIVLKHVNFWMLTILPFLLIF
jgi:hypothetical protein